MNSDNRLKFSLQNVRRIWAGFFLVLFFLLIYLTDFRHLKGYEVPIFLEIDPLVWLSGLLTGWTVYKGLALALLIIIPTIFLGRFFCSWICPLGILIQISGWLLQKRKAVEDYSANRYKTVYRFKYYLLASLLVMSLFGASQIGLFDPVVTVYRAAIISIFPATDTVTGAIYRKTPVYLGGVLLSAIFLVIIFANRFTPRLWCRLICPTGALLGLMSAGAIYRIRRDVNKCTDCMKCLSSCQGACEPEGELRIAECHVCMNCITDCPEDALSYGLATANSSAQQPLDINRRRLLETVALTTVFFPMFKTSLTGATNAQAAVIRPPGSLPEPDFLRRCIKCAMCMKVCPTNVLQPALLEGGFEGLWSPILVNTIGYCEHHCTLCGQVCPTGAIKPLTVKEKVGGPKSPPVKLGTAFYDRGRCLPWAMNTECIVCEEVCPTTPKAIWFEEVEVEMRGGGVKKLKRPFVEPSRCIGCGICENKCPVRDKRAIRVTSVGESRSAENRMILKSRDQQNSSSYP